MAIETAIIHKIKLNINLKAMGRCLITDTKIMVKGVFIVNHFSEFVENGIEKVHIEGFSGMQIDGEKLIEKQFHSWTWQAKNEKALFSKIRREFGEIIFKK